ncbi:MAG: DUF29 domain-containing protein [Magnetococcales bacterium]|nr:DUF29 domain-containing protein [Magnetococcales bacterium]MBF0323292.1 DUF29 domain-containing protein [Magnetococcales bacterium]
MIDDAKKSLVLYEHDFYAWANEQAALLRAGKLALVDIDNIAGEIESMGREEKRELVHRLAILLLHLLKWQFQPTHRGQSWRLSIANTRDDITDHLADNPSLKSHLANAVGSAYRRACRVAAAETGYSENTFPEVCSWPFERLMDSGSTDMI